MHQIPLARKMILCGTMIAYIYVRTPNSNKRFFWNYTPRKALRIFKNLPQGQEGFFWDGLKSDIKKFVAECLVFQQNKVDTIKTPGLLQPLSIPSQCWEEVSMDFITGLPKSEGKSDIMVVVDSQGKF